MEKTRYLLFVYMIRLKATMTMRPLAAKISIAWHYPKGGLAVAENHISSKVLNFSTLPWLNQSRS
jgi:hypothetical protein